MRLLLATLFALTLAAAIPAAPNTPVTIKPGDYKMEWREQVSPGHRMLVPGRDFREMKSGELQRCSGLISKDARITDGPLRLVIDESKGTGTGYDTLYYVSPGSDPDALDFSRAVRMSLQSSRSNPMALETNDFPKTFDWPVGEGKDRQIKKVDFDYLQAIFVRPGENNTRRVTLGAITVSGGWFGKIDTDRGQLQAMLVDEDGDGMYGESVQTDPASGRVNAHESIKIGDEEELFTVASQGLHSIYPGKAASYDGKLYAVTVSSNGDTIRIRPYKGAMGKVKIRTVDSLGKSYNCCGAYAVSKDTICTLDSSLASDLPVGYYRISNFLVGPDPLNAMDGKFRFYQRRATGVSIEKDKTTTVMAGGPITLNIQTDPDTQSPSLKPGDTLNVTISPTIGSDRLEIYADPTMKIAVRNSKGKDMISGSASRLMVDYGYRVFVYAFTVPNDWKADKYTLTATLSGKPYQVLITGQKVFTVTH